MSAHVKLAILTIIVGIALFGVALLHKYGVLVSNADDGDLFQTLSIFYTALCGLTVLVFFINLLKEIRK